MSSTADRHFDSPPRTGDRKASAAYSNTELTRIFATSTVTPLWISASRPRYLDTRGHDEVEAILRPLTAG